MSGLLAVLAAAFLAGCNQDLAEFTDNGADVAYVDYGAWGALYPHEYDVQQAATYAIQNEHLSRGQYEYVNHRFGYPPPFRRIAASEGMHVAGWEDFFVQHGWRIPSDLSGRYVVRNKTLQEAFQTAVTAESLTIAMLNLFLMRNDVPDDFRMCCMRQKEQSMEHLMMFQMQMNPMGEGGSTKGDVRIAANPAYGHWGALDSNGYSLQQSLIYAIQDEHLAEAEYKYVNRKFNYPAPFRGIVNSEGMHIAALTNLFNQQGWPVPKNDGDKYIILVRTLREAYQVGVTAEIDNIAMYNKFLGRNDLPSSFRNVYTNLRDASVNHQNAFQKHLDGGGSGGGGWGGGRH